MRNADHQAPHCAISFHALLPHPCYAHVFLTICSGTPWAYVTVWMWETKFHTHIKHQDVFTSSLNHHHLFHSRLIKVRKLYVCVYVCMYVCMCVYVCISSLSWKLNLWGNSPILKWFGLLQHARLVFERYRVFNFGQSTAHFHGFPQPLLV